MYKARNLRSHRQHAYTPLCLPVFFFLAITLSSCDLFTTRTPDAPDLGSTFIWTPASTYNDLLNNFQGTMQVLDATNYTKCFFSPKDTALSGDKFTYSFTPRSGLDASSRSIFDLWNIESEQNFMTKLRNSLVANPRLSVVFTNVQPFLNTNTATVNANYSVTLPVNSSSSVPDSVSGSMILQLAYVTTEQGTKEWRIVGWSDFAPSSGSGKTFTDLKLLSS
jgi:hypothetical protein